MALTTEEISELKAQLYTQIESLPEDKKAAAKKQIDEMSEETLEYLLKQSQSQQSQPKEKEESIFRLIAAKKIDSIIVGENKQVIAVLDINPISNGHTLIIPKVIVKDSKNMPNAAFTLAKSISKRIMKQLGAKNTEIHSENKLGECILHIIPVYNTPVHLGSPRQKSQKEDLIKIAQKIKVKKRQRVVKIKEPVSRPAPQIVKRRVP